jgi:hypothetical protein
MKETKEEIVVTHITPAPSEIPVSSEAPTIPQATTVTHETVESESTQHNSKHKKGKK